MVRIPSYATCCINEFVNVTRQNSIMKYTQEYVGFVWLRVNQTLLLELEAYLDEKCDRLGCDAVDLRIFMLQ